MPTSWDAGDSRLARCPLGGPKCTKPVVAPKKSMRLLRRNRVHSLSEMVGNCMKNLYGNVEKSCTFLFLKYFFIIIFSKLKIIDTYKFNENCIHGVVSLPSHIWPLFFCIWTQLIFESGNPGRPRGRVIRVHYCGVRATLHKSSEVKYPHKFDNRIEDRRYNEYLKMGSQEQDLGTKPPPWKGPHSSPACTIFPRSPRKSQSPAKSNGLPVSRILTVPIEVEPAARRTGGTLASGLGKMTNINTYQQKTFRELIIFRACPEADTHFYVSYVSSSHL